MLYVRNLFFPQHGDCDIGEVPDDGFDVPSDVTDLSELGGFHLDERCTRELRQASGDFCFAHARRPNHEDVFRRDFVTHLFAQLHASPAIAQGNGNSPFGIILADDVSVQLVNDFSWDH